MSQSRVKYHDVSTVPYGEIFLWACSATGLLAPTSREAPKQEGKGAFRGLRARRRPISSWLCQHVLELWSFNFRARLRGLFGCTWKDIDNAFVQYYYLRGVLTCPKYLWNTVKHCTFSLVFFNFFLRPYSSFNASYDQQVSEPSCILDLRRVPPGVGRVGLQALIFPVSIYYVYNFFKLDWNMVKPLSKSLHLWVSSKEVMAMSWGVLLMKSARTCEWLRGHLQWDNFSPKESRTTDPQKLEIITGGQRSARSRS